MRHLVIRQPTLKASSRLRSVPPGNSPTGGGQPGGLVAVRRTLSPSCVTTDAAGEPGSFGGQPGDEGTVVGRTVAGLQRAHPMKVRTQTLEQLARVLDVDERKVSRTARRVLGLTAMMARDPTFTLSRNHCRQIAQALGRARPVGGGVDTVRAVEPEGGATAGVEARPLREGRAGLRQPAARRVGASRGAGRSRRDDAASPTIGHRAAAPGGARAHDRGQGLPGRGEPRVAALAARRQRRRAVLPVVDGAGEPARPRHRVPRPRRHPGPRGPPPRRPRASRGPATSTTTWFSRSTRSRTPISSAGPGRRINSSSSGTKARCAWCTAVPGRGRRPCCGRRSRRAAGSASST